MNIKENEQSALFLPTAGPPGPTTSTTSGQSSVISNSLDKQKIFVFKGRGFFNMSPSDDRMNVYSSKIIVTERITDPSDQYNHYGYRNYNTDSKSDSNFVIDDINDTWSSMYDYGNDCGQTYTSYGFPSGGIVGNLYIKDIEVKLNHLNYPNSKNLIVWLDIKNPSIPAVVSNSLFADPKNISDYSSNTNLQNYLNALSGMNIHTNGLISRIYLLNQEHISNYETNFSIKFSDNADKNISTNRQNYTHSSELGNVSPVLSNASIQPTLYAMGYNDPDSALYAGNIKTNQINSTINAFAKFKNIPLQNTEFILNIGLISPIDHNTQVMDNLLINSLIAGGMSTENYSQSSTLNNSLCSWEIKINTENTQQYSNKDILGKINYSGYIKNGSSSLASGYNFIGNFSGVPYLIPNVNINAPYDFLANINKCSYDDPTAGRNWSIMRPTLQENLSTVHMGFMQYSLAGMMIMGSSMGTAVGAVGSLYALQAIYERGGRNDPIINMFIENRLLDQTEAQDSQFYKPIYKNKYFGLSDRAVICISPDNLYWYDVEVPIFKLINSFVIEKNTYKYIKLHGNILKNISQFNYSPIKNYTDLNLGPVVYTFKTNISSLSGLATISDLPAPNVLEEGDMVLLTGQNTSADNGYYIVSSGGWTKVPSLANSYFLQKNNISPLFTESSLSGGTNIIIQGHRAYNFFDKSESVSIENLTGLTSATIQGKSYIQTVDGVKTVLTLDTAINSPGTIYKNSTNANVLWLYKDGVTSVNAVNSWNLEKTKNEKAENLNPDNFSVAYGEGSTNFGTDILNPEIFYKVSFSHNEILETNKLLNNQENDKLKFNQVLISSPSSTQYISFTDSDLGNNLLKGYSYSSSQFINKTCNSESLFDNKNLESLRLKESLLSRDFTNQYFMEIKSDKFKGLTIPDSGSVYIENDFKAFIPISFSDNDWTSMQNRLSLIATGTGVGQLKYEYSRYYSLPTDPSGCYSSGTYSSALCPKTEALQKTKILEEEKRQLEYALMSPRASNAVTVPFVSGIVAQNSDGSYNIRYNPNNYHYWFHIDPEQECRLNDELSVKILKKTRIRPIPISEVINEGIAGSESHITPASNVVVTTGVSSNEKLEISGLTYSYEITPSGLDREKAKWPGTVDWTNGETFKYGELTSAGDSKKFTIARLDSSKSMVIWSEEEYIRPSGTFAKKYGKVKDRINLANTNELSVKFKNIPRKLKGIDSEDFERYIYDKEGNLLRSVRPPSSVGQIANNFTCWHCINPSGQYIENIPPYYKLANEMRYRAFYGSTDGIEHKNSVYLDTKDDWEWIPYEYYYDNNVSSGPSNGQPNYGAIATFLDGQKPIASTNQQLNYFSVMNASSDTSIASSDDTQGVWKVYITYISKQGMTKTIETSMGAGSKSNLYDQLDMEKKKINSNIYYYSIGEKLPPLQGPIYTYPTAWDSEKDTDNMTPDRILDFEIVKIKKITYRIPACSAGPERTHYTYTRTEFRKNGEYIYSNLDYTFFDTRWKYDFSGNDFDPFTNQPILRKIDLASIFRETFGELDALNKEYRLLDKVKTFEEAKIEGNSDIILKAIIRMQELQEKINQLLAYNALYLSFVQKIEYATGESGAFLAVNPEDYPCATNPSRVEPYWINYWLYGRILWNSTKDLGAREQRLRYQDFYSWPEKSVDEILSAEYGNVF